MTLAGCETIPSLGDSATMRVIELYDGYDWRHDVVLKTGVWSEGSTAEVRWENGVVWAATVAGNALRFRVDKADTASEKVPDGTAFELAAMVPSGDGGTDDILLHYGRAYRPKPIS